MPTAILLKIPSLQKENPAIRRAVKRAKTERIRKKVRHKAQSPRQVPRKAKRVQRKVKKIQRRVKSPMAEMEHRNPVSAEGRVVRKEETIALPEKVFILK